MDHILQTLEPAEMGKGNQNDDGERLKEEDLLIEVLSRLDVKTLLQCKSVSKPWYSLISTPIFIKSHLNRTLNGADNQTANLIVRRRNKKHGSFSLFQLGGCDDLVANLDFPYSKGDYVFTSPSMVIGCVCGIVCLYVASVDANQVKERTDIYIWNPAIKQSKLIPAHTFHPTRAFGFGYDPIDFDFKVVRVLSKAIFPEVYSLNRNVWRKIETKLSDTPNRKFFEIFLHGFLFTIGLNGMMMAFDLNIEVFVCDIELPARSDDACLSDFKDSIAVILSNCGDDMINLWTLDDEACLRGVGVEASWTMMLTIDVGVRVDWVYGIFNSVEFLLESGDCFSYNLDKKVGRYIDTNPFFDFVDVFKYTESLVPVAGSKLVNWSDDVDDNEESSTDSEEVSEESSVDLEDGNERSSVGIGSEDDNEKSTVGLEDDEESSGDFVDANEEKSADSVFKYTESLLPVAGSKVVNWSDDVDDNEESCKDSEEVSEGSSVDSEDADDERSSVGVGSEDDSEESTADPEDYEESIVDSEDENEEKSADSGDE